MNLVGHLSMATLISPTETPMKHFLLSTLEPAPDHWWGRSLPCCPNLFVVHSRACSSQPGCQTALSPQVSSLTTSHSASRSSYSTPPHTLPFALFLHLLYLLSFCPLFFFHLLTCLIHGGLKAEAKAPSSLTHLYDLLKRLHFVPSFLDSVAVLAALLENSSVPLSPYCLLPTATPFYTLTGKTTLVLFLSPHADPGPSPPASPISFSCSPSSPESQHCSLKAG